MFTCFTRRKMRKFYEVNMKGETPLHLAARNKGSDGGIYILNLLAEGLNINARNKWGQTPLHYAAIACCLHNIETLAKSPGIDVNSRDINGYNALQSLISANDGDSIDHLHAMDNYVESLLLSDSTKDIEIPETLSVDLRKCLQALVNTGSDLNNQTTFGHGILHLVAKRKENTPLLKFFISNFPDLNLNLLNKNNENFVHVYVSNERLEEIIDLFESMAIHDLLRFSLSTLLSSKDILGRTPWYLMISGEGFYYTSTETLKKIFSYGVSSEVNDNLENTILHRICGVSHGDAYVDVLQYLLEIGANINAQNMYGEPVLSLTLCEQILKVFLKFNADCRINDRWRRSALMSMMKYRPLPDLLRIFIATGTVDVNSSDIYGSTPLHFAAYHNYEEQIELLLKYGADINARDILQEKPLDTAKRHRSFRCIAQLKASGKTFMGHITQFLRSTLFRDETFEKILHGLPETITSSNIQSPQGIQVLLHLPLNSKHFMNYIFESYFTRSQSCNTEFESVLCDVNNLVRSLCTQIQKYDSRFEMSVLPSGSMAEGTKIGRPDEFDFILSLDKLNDITYIVMTDNLLKTGFAFLKFRNIPDVDEYLPFTDADGFFLPILYLQLFYHYLQRALHEPHLWKKGNFYFNVENRLGKVFGKPVFTFDVYWLGSIYKQLRISIDLVPAVYKRGWWPPNIDVDKIPLINTDIKSAGCFLTLQSETQHFAPNDWDCISRTCNNEDYAELAKNKMLRISAAPAEICLMKSLPNEFRQAYVLAKVLKNICPEIDIETKQYKLVEADSKYTKPRRTNPSKVIKSYMLKNSAFYVLEGLKKKNQSEDEFDVLDISAKMYSFLLQYVGGQQMHMRPYFLSPDINVFENSKKLSFDKAFILHLQREFSIKLVLGIMNEQFPTECLTAKM